MAVCEPLYSAFASASLPAMSGSATMCLRQQLLEQKQQRLYSGARSGASGMVHAPCTAAAAQPQHRASRPRSSGCRHCVACLPVHYAPSAEAAVAARRNGSAPQAAAEEWWPAGLSTPTLYFQLRRRQLQLQCRTSAVAPAHAKLWRPPEQTQSSPSQLLARRGARPLGLLIPATYTNVQPSETRVQLVAVLDAPCRMAAAATAAAPAAADTAAAAGTQPDPLCSSMLSVPCAKAAPAAAPLSADAVAEAWAAAADAAWRSAAAPPHRAQRAASLPSPAKRTRLDVLAAVELLGPSPFAAAASLRAQQQASQAQQLRQAQWADWQPAAAAAAPFVVQLAQQAQQARQAWWLQQPAALAPPAEQLPRAAQLQGSSEFTSAGPALPCAFGTGSSGPASLCLSSVSLSSDASSLTALSHSSLPLASTTSVLPPLPPPTWPAAAPTALCGGVPSAPTQLQQQPARVDARGTPKQPQQQPLQHQQWQWQAQLPFGLPQQQQQQTAEQESQYWQRLHAIKAERAYPVVLELPQVQPAVTASEQGVAAALSSLLRLLSKRKAN